MAKRGRGKPKAEDLRRAALSGRDHPGQLVTKAMLFDAEWAELSISDSMPATCVAELRTALGDDGKTPRFIETVHRRDYRFIAQVIFALTEAKALLDELANSLVSEAVSADASHLVENGSNRSIPSCGDLLDIVVRPACLKRSSHNYHCCSVPE